MVKKFVAINDPVHQLLRALTRRTPLCPITLANGSVIPCYKFDAGDLPEEYYSLAMFHACGGMSLQSLGRTLWGVRAQDKERLVQRVNGFDLVKLDRRCARDLRLKLRSRGHGMLAAEILTYGTGTLRARNDDPLEQLHQHLWSRHGRLQTRHEIVHGTVRALHRNSWPLLHQVQKESYDSTNVIYGDVMGELEQLWDRRADTAFLDQVAQSLRSMRSHAEIAALLQPPMNLEEVMKTHLRCQAVWRKPPPTARSLLRRVEDILGNTIVDNAPQTIFKRQGANVPAEPSESETQGSQWRVDVSGYDGWLIGSDDSVS